jgi:predicted P-loop ATPase
VGGNMSAVPVGDWLPERKVNGGASSREPANDWRSRLIRGKPTKDGPGAAKPILANAITALRCAPEFSGVLGFNEFSLGIVMLKPAPWDGAQVNSEWTDHEDRLTADWLQHQGIFVSVEITGQAVQAVAKDRAFHPVREYLGSLHWDGTKRIEGWLSLHLGVEPSDYTAAVGARWLVSAVARIYRPGCKADCCLILEGPQGLKKSTALKILADPWFTDEIADLGSKDAALQTRGVWVIEIAELDSMTRADVGRIKAFMSRAVDRFRPPYGRRLIESPRQCIFAGSVNLSSYLRDETGARRFWPVLCTRVLIEDLARDRDQLWAEAATYYHNGGTWWLDTPELNRQAEDEQAARYEGDAWDALVLAWAQDRIVSGSASVSVAEALDFCLGKKRDQWTKADEMRVGRCLRAAKWERYRDRQRAMEWRYKPPVPTQGGNVGGSGNAVNS